MNKCFKECDGCAFAFKALDPFALRENEWTYLCRLHVSKINGEPIGCEFAYKQYCQGDFYFANTKTKYCTACKHCIKGKETFEGIMINCNLYPEESAKYHPNDIEAYQSCDEARGDKNKCGNAGKYFKPKNEMKKEENTND